MHTITSLAFAAMPVVAEEPVSNAAVLPHLDFLRLVIPGRRPNPYQPGPAAQVHPQLLDTRAASPAHTAAGPMSEVSCCGHAALNIYGIPFTHGVAMGWYDAGPLALKSAMSFSGTTGQFSVNSKPRFGSPKMDMDKIVVTATGDDAKLVEFEAHDLKSIWQPAVK